MRCSACGTPNIRPRITTNSQGRTEIVTEAKWVCHQCGAYFHRGFIDRQPKVAAPASAAK